MENSVIPFEIESIVNQIEVGKCKFVMSMVFLNTGDLLKVSQFLIKAMVLKTFFFIWQYFFPLLFCPMLILSEALSSKRPSAFSTV